MKKISECCDKMKERIKVGQIYYSEKSTHIHILSEFRFADVVIYFCPFCGERLEVI